MQWHRRKRPRPGRRARRANGRAQGTSQAAARGDVIEVAPGDTLYGLSRRHQVSVAELMSVNSLTPPTLKPGQKLYLPAGKSARMAAATPQAAAAAMPAAAPMPSAAVTAAPTAVAPAVALAPPTPEQLAKYNSTYTVKPGDSLYAVARAHKVTYSELQQVNAISNPLKVRPGAVLKVPAGYAQTAAAHAAAMAGRSMAGRPMATGAVTSPSASERLCPPLRLPGTGIAEPAPTGVPAGSAQPTIINAAKPSAPVAPRRRQRPPQRSGQRATGCAQRAEAQTAAGDTSKLRWPAQGKIIAGFGGRADGTHNDGINLSVPQGTEVHAAESGVVAYAGSELKGYGNLVLVRHENGWVTAYAHNAELLVKRGDKV